MLSGCPSLTKNINIAMIRIAFLLIYRSIYSVYILCMKLPQTKLIKYKIAGNDNYSLVHAFFQEKGSYHISF